jgi:8-oxo-dGTP diphosphatase
MSVTYSHPRPAITVDTVVFGYDGMKLQVLLVQRGQSPYKGRWALPGGFVQMSETLEDAARRELEEETGLTRIYLEQLFTFGGIDRDPRGRVISVTYFALVKLSDQRVQAGSDASLAAWYPVEELPSLAFDHDSIVACALERLRGKVRYRPIGFELLPQKFPLRQLQALYEIVLGSSLDKRNFRKKVLAMGLLQELEETEQQVSHRAARLYRFDEKSYRRLSKQGFEFSL